MTSWYNENPFHITGPLWGWGTPPVTGGFPSQKVSNASLWCFFDVLSPKKLLDKHLSGRRFETQWHSCDVIEMRWRKHVWKSVKSPSFCFGASEFTGVSLYFISFYSNQFPSIQTRTTNKFIKFYSKLSYFKLEQQSKQHFINSLLWNLL